jgi:hypothetical protein
MALTATQISQFKALGYTDAQIAALQTPTGAAALAQHTGAPAPQPSYSTTQTSPRLQNPFNEADIAQQAAGKVAAATAPPPPPPRLDMPQGTQPGAPGGPVQGTAQALDWEDALLAGATGGISLGLDALDGGIEDGGGGDFVGGSGLAGANGSGGSIVVHGPTNVNGGYPEREEQIRNPDGSLSSVPKGTDAYTYQQMDPSERIIANMMGASLDTRDTNRDAVTGAAGASAVSSQQTNQLVDQMRWDQLGRQQGLVGAASQGDQSALNTLGSAGMVATQQDQLLRDSMTGLWGGSIAADQAAVGGLQSAAGTASGQDYAALSELGMRTNQANSTGAGIANNLAGRADSYQNLQAADWGPDLQSQAAGTRADQQAIDTQRQGLATYGGVAGGNFDINSALANVYADPRTQQTQEQALGRMGNLAAGNQDLTSQAATAAPNAGDTVMQQRAATRLLSAANGGDALTSEMAGVQGDNVAMQMQRNASGQYNTIAGGSRDLTSAAEGVEADAGAIDAQRDFLSQYQEGSNPAMSATERFMMEDARRTEERDRSSAMAGKMREMQARGMLGSGDEIAAMLGAQSTTSQNRMMQDLAALASSQQRAERQQAQGTALAGSMRGSSFAEGMDKAGARDQMAVGNRDVAMDALQQYANSANMQRGQTFTENAARAGAADDFALGNRDVALQSANQLGALGSQMRDQGMSEAMARGTAADQMATGNRDARIQGIDMYGNYASALNDQSFQQAATRAGATDATAAGNRDVRLGGIDSQTGLAGQMRGSSFAEGMATGSAADAFSQFNRTGSLAQQNYNTELQRQQQDAEWARISQAAGMQLDENQAGYQRGATQFDAQRSVTDAGYGRSQDIYGAQTDATNNAYTRAENLAQTGYDANQAAYGRSTDYASATSAKAAADYSRGSAANADYNTAISDFYGRQRDSQGDLKDYTGLYTGQGTRDNAAMTEVQKLQLGAIEAKKAQDALKPDDIIPDDIPILGGFL